MSDQCELCSNNRVFPCLYHCKKMLCIEHLSEHERLMNQQNQLRKLWENFQENFDEKKIEEEVIRLQNQLENYRKLKDAIENLLSTDDVHRSNEYQQAIEMIERDLTDFISSESTSSSIEDLTSSPCYSNNVTTNDEDSFQQSNRKIVPSTVRDYCPLTRDGAFGIHSRIHGVRLCPDRSRKYLLSQHFRCVHHLTPTVSLTMARAIASGHDPMETRLFNDDQVILNLDELRSVNCPMNKPMIHYPDIQIPQLPCNTIKQVRHLKDHLCRAHQLTKPAANLIIKLIKNDLSIERIQFPPHVNILQN